MFTGLIEQVGTVKAIQHLPCETAKLWVTMAFPLVNAGESLAVNGVCLTALPDSSPECAVFDISPETSKLTTLRRLKAGDPVHLERAMRADSRLHGHFVTGHVDTTLTVKSKQSMGAFVEMVFQHVPETMRAYLVTKGSIAINGVSLTINAIQGDTVTVMLIPYTISKTHLDALKVGDSVNVEFDYLMKQAGHTYV